MNYLNKKNYINFLYIKKKTGTGRFFLIVLTKRQLFKCY